jgi:hypothetical protein
MNQNGMKICPQCDGEGTCAYEEAVADYGGYHGGYLEEFFAECDMCGGWGVVDEEDEDED